MHEESVAVHLKDAGSGSNPRTRPSQMEISLAVETDDGKAFVEVALPLPLPQTFTYRLANCGAGEVQAGVRVLVPFGPRRLIGIVTGFPRKAPGETELRSILEVLDRTPLLREDMMELGQWLSRYYLAPIGEAFRVMLPPALLSLKAAQRKRTESHWPTRRQRMITSLDLSSLSLERTARQTEVMEQLAALPLPTTLAQASSETGCSPGLLDRLWKQGALQVEEVEVYRSPWQDRVWRAGDMKKHALTTEQERVFKRIRRDLAGSGFRSVLLHGVTGSGKTELYLNTISRTLERGRSALVLVPEIGLTPQVASQFRSWFGDRVAILHSNLSEGERFDEWRRIRDGQAPVVVGTRSAVFAPLTDLGTIIVDEEHDASYKQEDTPRYNARDVALKRAQDCGALVILGSATPQLESYYAAKKGSRPRLESLRQRVGRHALPKVHVVDMRVEFQHHGREHIFSKLLSDSIRDRLQSGQQTLILLNRRGYANSVLCRSCGHTEDCRNCSVSLTYHRGWSRLICHYCGYSTALPRNCPECQKEYLHYLGTGTEKVEEKLRELFPDVRMERVDRDTTRRRGSLPRILRDFYSGRTDILVGTQMIAKGHDFPGVTLVGVLAADMGLRLADFRAAERTFQLLTQVAGRAGRGKHPGEVVLQTYFPNHYSLKYACQQDYERFFEQEIRFRRRFRYPPFTALANLLVRGPGDAATVELATRLCQHLVDARDRLSDPRRLRILGPAPASIHRLKGDYRVQILLKTTSREELNQVIREGLGGLSSPQLKRVVVDIDPINLL